MRQRLIWNASTKKHCDEQRDHSENVQPVEIHGCGIGEGRNKGGDIGPTRNN